MAAEDYAILVGISKYPNPGFAPLEGPKHDLELVKGWLTDLKGGAVPADRIKLIDSSLCRPPDSAGYEARPTYQDFEKEYLALEAARMAMKGERVAGRLYLYFSGHGFCGREINRDAEAALYCANAAATKDFYPHIYGTYFARRAKQKALFAEIVLVMDCCRDSEVNRMPMQPALANTPDDTVAANVRVLAVYAVPRGGKAHERAIAEREGKVHGLLTHALLKTLEEARPTKPGMISATCLRDYLLESWDTVSGADAAPRPDIYLPTSEMFFPAKNTGTRVQFTFGAPPAEGATLVLRDGKLKKIGQLTTNSVADDLYNDPILEVAHDGSSIQLRLLPGFYEYELTGPAARKGSFKAQGGDVHVSL